MKDSAARISTMSPSDLPSFADARRTTSLDHTKGGDDPVENAKEETSRPNANFKTASTEEKPFAGVDVSAKPWGFHSLDESAPAEGIDEAGRSPPIFDELRYLQERLLYLEDKIARGFGEELGNATPLGEEAVSSEQEDLKLRKQIRRAAAAEKSVRNDEVQAAETADQRKSYGQGPNKIPSPTPRRILDASHSSMYHIRDDGTVFEGPQYQAIMGSGSWAFRDQSYNRRGIDIRLRSQQKPYPHRGSRPPTALRPIYGEKYNHKSTLREDAKSSRKLGPPTQWDESDSEEWSSETSTRSQDFNYFRARLRGDFEWELDRLNAQVERFKRHKAKKEARQRALKTEKEGVHENKEHRNAEQHCLADQGQGSLVKDCQEAARPKLNPIGWETFQNAKRLKEELAYVIDVLTEEPKVGSEAWPPNHSKRSNKSPKNYKAATTAGPGHLHRTALAGKGKAEKELQPDSEISSYQLDQFSGKDPLPERIRVNSPSIIEVLSNIRGAPICKTSSRPLILLRPFKILSAYEKEIRQLSSQVVIDLRNSREKQGLPEDTNTHATPLDSTSANKSATELSPNTTEAHESDPDKTDTVKWRDLMVRKEHLDCLQDFIEHYIVKKSAYLNSLDCNKIAFMDLWYLFRPGMTVISADGKQAYQVVSVRSKTHKGTDRRLPWATFQYAEIGDSDSSISNDRNNGHKDMIIKCVYIHFDGRNVGPVVRTFGINKWDGVKDLASLDVFPLRLYVLSVLKERAITSLNSMAITEEGVDRATRKLQHDLIKRGRKFVEAAAVKHMYYSGLAVDTRDEIESQVVIDFEAAFSDDARDHWRPKIRRLRGTDWSSENKSNGEKCTADCCRGEDVLDDSYIDTDNSQNFVNNLMSKIEHTSHKFPSAVIFPRPLDENRSRSETFTEDELMIMSYSVFGFVLRDRTWGKPFSSLNLSLHNSIRFFIRNNMLYYVEKANGVLLR